MCFIQRFMRKYLLEASIVTFARVVVVIVVVHGGIGLHLSASQ